ncbi:MAG: TVP38/TMEM64 family protein [Gammaproteobacteria bacterium]|nr:TVP38/TMEM64 family protein [Gammaproteobacteria bacterium]
MDPPPHAKGRRRAVFLIPLMVLLTLGAGYVLLDWAGALALLRDPEALQDAIAASGWLGPAAIVGLMCTAIVFSPLPSAPIALAAGTVYGHTLGTLYVLLGAELGAIIAFVIARTAGRAAVERWVSPATLRRLQGSQGMLMTMVFLTRLMPFISFDAVSYAAGVTPLAFWRFALATLAGILPASFLLAHFGSELAAGGDDNVVLAVQFLGLGLLIPLMVALVRRLRRGPADGNRV